jgi:folate-binding protein YgfZ
MAAENQAGIQTPLADMHRAAGAEMGGWFGCVLPSRWRESAEEERYAAQSVALIDKNYRAYLAFSGPDRVRYLNAILTNNIKDLTAGQGVVSLLLNPQGRILAEIETYAREETLFCVSYQMIRPKLVEWLEKYIIMDDVTLTEESEAFGMFALEGPKAAELVKQVAGVEVATLAELQQVDAHVNGIPCKISRRSPGHIPGAEFLAARADLQSLWQALEQATHVHGGGPMGYHALSARRLSQGIPWFGYDYGEQQIPHEAGLENSHISYTKGCYTGQEIVERVRSRGQVNRRRVLLKFDGDAIPTAGMPLTVEGKEIGHVTRAAKSWWPPAVRGMAYVRKEQADPGSMVQWPNGKAVVVRD